MKASELVEKLKVAIIQHGDCPVVIGGYYGDVWGTEITDLNFENLSPGPTSTLKEERRQFMLGPHLGPEWTPEL